MEQPKGKLIVFEGGEGSGKTTQIKRLMEWCTTSPLIQGLIASGKIKGVVDTREPGGTPLCEDIRHLLLNTIRYDESKGHYADAEPIHPRTELLLYAADRAQHVESFIKPKLNEGYIVLCDRFTSSTVAYQGYGRGLNLHLIDQLNQVATDGLAPDFTFFLSVHPKIGLERSESLGQGRDRVEQESIKFHGKVWQGLEAEFAISPVLRRSWLNTNLTPECEVASLVVERFSSFLQSSYGIN